jgi:transcription termination factor Rho
MSDSDFAAEFRQSDSGESSNGATDPPSSRAPRKRAPRKTAARRSTKREEAPTATAPSAPAAATESAAPAPVPAVAPAPRVSEPTPSEAPPVPVREFRSPEHPSDAPSAMRSEPASGSDSPSQQASSGGRKRHRKRKRRGGNRESYNAEGARIDRAPNSSPGEADEGFSEEDGEESESLGEGDGGADAGENDGPRAFKTRKQRFLERKEQERARELAALEASPAVESEGLVEISPKGFGFLRERIRGFQQSPKDVFITPEVVRIFGLRDGHMVRCVSKMGIRGPQLIEILAINDRPPEECARQPYFEELTAINPNKKLTLETDPTRFTTRVIDLVAPIGRGQRGLIVAPPRTGKTTFLHHIAEGLLKNYEDEIHLMVLLVDERPEEVTDFERSFPDVEVFSSSNDSEAKDHTRIALLATERAKRLVEGGRHVVMLMDSITRLARAFNSQMRGGGKRGTASGGLIVGALEVPRRIFAAARNTREAGSLTIIATALVQTNSKADEAIFQEFKGTGNMELVLDRQLAQNYVYPAVDINKSGTRREELLLPPHVLEKIYIIRRGLSGYRPLDAMEWLLRCMHRYQSNAQMLMDIKVTALA